MKHECSIDIRHLPRIEGHGDIHIRVSAGKLVEARWSVVETPRFFEAMLRGMSAERVPFLTSRICGICSISNSLASIRALERAMKITPPPVAETTRMLALQGETIQSHALHIFFFAACDFVGIPSVKEFIKLYPDMVRIGIRLKELGNAISKVTAGRSIHPVSMVVGGIARAPERAVLEGLLPMIEDGELALDDACAFFRGLKIPQFERETEFVSLCNGSAYPLIGGDLVSSDGVCKDEDDYLLMTNEYLPDFSTSKFTRLSRESCATGALARVTNNFSFLSSKARLSAESLGLRPGCHNPFMNSVAQLVECVHILQNVRTQLTALLGMDLTVTKTRWTPVAGAATGALEAPRGTLYHYMETDREGMVVKADCIIPTTQNNANIHFDLHALAIQSLRSGKSEAETEKLCSMLVRSYDPCLSCSVH